MLGAASFVLALVAQAMRPDFEFMVSDARGYYAYVPSMIIDHDLDLSNQLARRDTQEGSYTQKTPIGRVNDKYPIGVSVTLIPEFLVAHVVSTAIYGVAERKTFEPNGYTILYELLAVAFVIGLATATMLIADDLSVRYLDIEPNAVAIAIALYWLGTPYLYYVFRQPIMSHVIGAFWMALSVWTFERARTRWLRSESAARDVMIFALAAGMAVITRPTNVGLLLFALYLFWIAVRLRAGSRRRELLLLGLGAVPLFAQLWVWKQMSGSYFYYGYGAEVFHWLQPKLLQTLFSSRHGLFFWTPLMLFAVLGLARHLATQTALVRLGALALLWIWLANSAWETWWFGGSFGARAFLDYSIFLIVGLALHVQDRHRAGARAFSRSMVLASACVGYSWVLMALFMFKRIPIDDYLLAF